MFVCQSSTIQHGYCQCPVGLAQTCSHIGSLLFALSHAKLQDSSCTSLPCTWNVPGRAAKPPGPMNTLIVKKPKLPCATEQVATSNSELDSYDPRHSSDRVYDLPKTLQHLRDIKDVFPNTGMSHLWNIGDHVPEAIQEEEIQTEEDQMFLKMKSMIYSNSNLPQLSIEQDLVKYIETHTRGQRSSEMWQNLHIGRLTSSIFGEILNAGPQPNSLVKQIVEGSTLNRYTTLPPAVQWGIEKEPQAREDYVDLQSTLSHQIRVEDTGLTLCASHSYLGASSDGRVIDGESI